MMIDAALGRWTLPTYAEAPPYALVGSFPPCALRGALFLAKFMPIYGIYVVRSVQGDGTAKAWDARTHPSVELSFAARLGRAAKLNRSCAL